jgi:glycosyltransferase involved in cell wall biosynthesis
MRAPRFDAATFARGIEKMRGWCAGTDTRRATPANLELADPKMWPWFRSAFDRRVNRWSLHRQIGPSVASLPMPRVAVTTVPIVADLIGLLPVDEWVYYCVDDLSVWPGLDHRTIRRMEHALLEKVEKVVAVSETLCDRLAAMGRPAHLLTHGVDLDLWNAANSKEEPPQALMSLARPLIVFWGLIDRRLDVSFLRRLANDLESGTIVLVGPEQDRSRELDDVARVVRLPALPMERLPSLARAAAVLIMPYGDSPVTRAIQPLKLKEYLATGRPTVVRDLPANRAWADCLDLAATAEEFSNAVRLRLATGLAAEQRLARKRLRSESWDQKAIEFETVALDGIEHSR